MFRYSRHNDFGTQLNLTDVHTEIASKMQQCIKIYYSMFIWSSTCFGWHTAHHQELKIALAASGFAHVKGWWTSTSTFNNLSRMQNQRLLVQFWAHDGQCVARNTLSFI